MALRDYLNIPADATVDAKLETQRQIINALRQAEAIRTRPAFAPLSALSIPSTISATLAKTIESVAADAEARLTIHIRRHGMQEQGERWIGEGIPYVVEDECPFCGRDGLGDLDLIKSYQAHFSEAYESLSREVARLRADVDRTFGDAAQGRIQTQIERNAAALEFWQHHCAVNRAAMRLEHHALAQVQQVRAGLTALLDRKASAPLQPSKRRSGASRSSKKPNRGCGFDRGLRRGLRESEWVDFKRLKPPPRVATSQLPKPS